MSDEQLLQKYKDYTKKRAIIIIISLLLILGISVIILFPKKNTSSNKVDIEPSVIEEKKEDMPPILELTTNSIQITVGEEFDYKKYIKNAYDEVDGNLIEKVEFSKIDLSKEGTYEVVYYVFDSSNNIAQQLLTLIIEETPKEEIEPIAPEPPIQNNKPSSNENVNSNKNNNNKPVQPITKYFLFTDGYTMSNVVEVCAKELKESNRTGRCIPITDDNGIYLGMKLELN